MALSHTRSPRWSWDGITLCDLAILFIASMACSHFLIKSSDRPWAALLLDGGVSDGMRVGSYPKRIWLGASLVVAFSQLLCSAEAIVNHRVQSSGAAYVTSWRYCLTHWFFCSDIPSVWEWNTEDRFCCTPSFWQSTLLKWDVNQGSLSLIIFVGSPNYR